MTRLRSSMTSKSSSWLKFSSMALSLFHGERSPVLSVRTVSAPFRRRRNVPMRLLCRPTVTVRCGTITTMSGTDGTAGTGNCGVAGHFGRLLRRDRLAHGWSLAELARRTGVDPHHLGRVENGKRPPTARLADKVDAVFPERRGWYLQWLDDIRAAPEIPATFRSWSDYEDRAATLRVWMPSIIDGLAQTQDYARALLSAEPGISGETSENRLTARMARQRRVLGREQPPSVTLLVDESALYRLVGSPEVMAAELDRLSAVAAMRTVTLQVMPSIAHAALASGYVLADDAVWCEHLVSGGVYTDPQTVMSVAARHDSLRAECYRASESLALIRRLGETWNGGRAPTAPGAAGSA
jgi:transcriptional regulator with XRE-family HTH domain